jgi:hypothetical protein
MLPARIAKLLNLQTVRMLFPVLRGCVVAALAVVALQCNDFAHGRLLDNPGDGLPRFAMANGGRRVVFVIR